VRDFEFAKHGEPHDTTAQQPQPAVFPHFLAIVEQELHPDTDAEEGRSGFNGLNDRLDEVALMQHLHPRAERSHAREDDLVCAVELVWMLNKLERRGVQMV
jgi:hypothetical protein